MLARLSPFELFSAVPKGSAKAEPTIELRCKQRGIKPKEIKQIRHHNFLLRTRLETDDGAAAPAFNLFQLITLLRPLPFAA